VEGERVAQQLNAATPQVRLQLLFGSVAGFPTRARQHQPAGHRVSKWYTVLLDQSRPKAAANIARCHGAAMVSVSLVMRDTGLDAAGAQGVVCCAANALPEGAKMGEVDYKPFASVTGVRDLVDPERNNFVLTHRAQTMVYEPTPEGVAAGARKLLFSATPEQVGQGANLKAHLDKCGHYVTPGKAFVRPRRVGADGVHRCRDDDPARTLYATDQHYWGLPFLTNMAGAPVVLGACWVAVAYNGSFLKLGKRTKFHRSCAIDGWDQEAPPRWLRIDSELTHEEFEAIMVPPFKGFETGTVDFYFALCSTPPSEDGFLDMSKLRRHNYDRDVERAGARAKREFMGRSRRRLDVEDKACLDERMKEAKAEVYDEWMGRLGRLSQPVTNALYEPRAWPLWHPSYRTETGQSASARTIAAACTKRREVRDNAAVACGAEREFKRFCRAAPSGADTVAASASFQANGGGA